LLVAFGALFLAAVTRPLDLMVLRADDFADDFLAPAPSPDHFFFTAVLAADLDAVFLAIVRLRLFVTDEG
jgi:hypothetical protein